MKQSNDPSWLLALAVILALPTLACFGWYTQQQQGATPGSALWTLALPLSLIGLIGFCRACLTARSSRPAGSRRALWLWATFAVAPLAALLWLWR